MGHSVAQAFPVAVVQQGFRPLHVRRRHLPQVHAFREEVSQQPVRVLGGTPIGPRAYDYAMPKSLYDASR